jgi:hypothetical protein
VRRSPTVGVAPSKQASGRCPSHQQGKWNMSTLIRPDLKVLRTLPTIHQVAEPWGKLELKLETDDTRYWLTTEGVVRKTGGTPINYVLDYVTVEKRSDDGQWDLKAVYSPEAWKLSQGFDYCQMLYQELTVLQAELEKELRWDTVREVERIERELEVVNRTISQLSETVRSR